MVECLVLVNNKKFGDYMIYLSNKEISINILLCLKYCDNLV